MAAPAESVDQPRRQVWQWAGAIVVVGLIAFLWLHGTASHDTEDVVFRDPGDRTMFRVHLLQNYIDSLGNLGESPKTVQELTSDLVRDRRDSLGFDAWSRPFSFTRSGDHYQLRSPGPDGSIGTSDDLTLEGNARSHP